MIHYYYFIVGVVFDSVVAAASAATTVSISNCFAPWGHALASCCGCLSISGLAPSQTC